MSTSQSRTFDPRLDLMVERVVHVAPERAWAAWTEADHLRRWYAPAPGVISECEIDLRPGGVFRFVPRQPDGMTLERRGDATLCTTVALHRNEADRNHHADMGFHDGWGTVLDQLGTYAPTM